MAEQQSLKTIAVVRHGETDWNRVRRLQGRTEVPLNDTGRDHARAAANLLTATAADLGIDWARVITSPLGRARETGDIIATSLGLESPTTDSSLLERDFGEAEGYNVFDATERWPGLVIPGAESLSALTVRSSVALSRIVDDFPGSIVVAHGAMMHVALAKLSGSEVPRILNGDVWIVTALGPEPPHIVFRATPAARSLRD